MKSVILVNDIGTTSVRTCAIETSTGNIVSQSSKKYSWHHTKEGWTTMNPQEIWSSTMKTLETVLKDLENKWEPMALSFSYIGDSTILVDEDGHELYEMIPAFDNRAKKEIEEIEEIIGPERYIELTGGPVGLGCMCGKILWLKKNKPELFKNRKVQYFSIQQYFNACMGLEAINDYSLASRKTMYDSANSCWASEIIDKLGIRKEELGSIQSADTVIGEITHYGDVKLPKKIPVILGAHDSECGIYGLGISKNTPQYIANIAGTFDHLEFLDTQFHNFFPQYGNMMFRAPLEGDYVSLDASIAGSSIQWFLENVYGGGENPFDDLYGHINFDGMNNLIYVQGMEDSKAMFLKLNQSHTKYDMYQAIIEAVTYRLRSTIGNYNSIYPNRFRTVRSGGGGCKASKWMQLKADLFEMPIETTENLEISSVGAAMMAAVAIGEYKDMQSAAREMIKVGKVYVPNSIISQKYQENFQNYYTKYIPLKNEI